MLLHKSLSLNNCDIKLSPRNAEDPFCKFSGYASTFNGVDSYGDTVLPEAYDTVIKSLGDRSIAYPKMFVNHKSWDLPIGKWTSLTKDEHGLKVEGELTLGNPQSQAVKASLEHGTIDGLSIGYRLNPDDVEMVDGKDQKIRLIKNISELVEVSVVTFPADQEARVDLSSVKSALETINDIRDFENFLRDAGGFSKSLAKAVASQAKRLFSHRDDEIALEEMQLPIEVRQLIAANLSHSLKL
jgi:HK97 family phage prohead protease